jgi:hypothetical protein
LSIAFILVPFFRVAFCRLELLPSEIGAKNGRLPFMSAPKCQWLKNAEAAKELSVSERGIKYWKTQPATREALGAVRHGKQWRIPRPDNLDNWRFETRRRLKNLGLQLPAPWERNLRDIGTETARYYLESCRLWLAAQLTAVIRGPVTQEDIRAIHMLLQAGREVLRMQPDGVRVDTLKSKFPDRLRLRKFSDADISGIMSYWPEDTCFEQVRTARTLKQLEKVRRRVDVAQAAKSCRHLGQKPTARNMRPLLHNDMLAHINDTREILPGIVVQRPTSEKLRTMTLASVYSSLHGTPAQPVTIDFRQPQDGLPLRTFRRRHPSRQSPQKDIVVAVYGIRDSIPGADERPFTGKTPTHYPNDSPTERSG